MKILIPMITLLALSLVVVSAVGDGEDAQSRKAYYAAAIDVEIAKCRKGASLRASHSAHLRLKGHREARMVLFLEAHRDQLVEEMLAVNLKPNSYKVQMFLNDRYGRASYAIWIALSDF